MMSDEAWRQRPWVGFDLETTGANPSSARIVTAAIVGPEADAGATWLVNPGIPIPAEATAVHGISDADVASAGLPAADGCDQIARSLETQWAQGGLVVAYNAQYDFTVLVHELNRHQLVPLHIGPILDPLVLWRGVEKYRRGKKRLADAVERFAVPQNTKEHDAGADALAALNVMRALADTESMLALDAWTIDDIVQVQQVWHRQWAEDFAAWFAQQGNDPSGIDPSWPIGQSAP